MTRSDLWALALFPLGGALAGGLAGWFIASGDWAEVIALAVIAFWFLATWAETVERALKRDAPVFAGSTMLRAQLTFLAKDRAAAKSELQTTLAQLGQVTVERDALLEACEQVLRVGSKPAKDQTKEDHDKTIRMLRSAIALARGEP